MEKEILKEYIKKGRTFREIASLEDISESMVDYYVKKHDLRNHVINYKPTIFRLQRIDSIGKAYLVGFIAGDSHFTKTNMMQLTVAYRDRIIVEYLSDILNCEIKDSFTFNKIKRIYPNSTIKCKMPDAMTFFSNNLKKGRNLPIVSKKLEKHLIQGFFDAEGSITWGFRKDRGRLWQKVSFTSSFSLLEALQKILIKYGISSLIKPKSNDDCFVLSFSNESDVLNFLNLLPKDGFYLKRKRERYLNWLEELVKKYDFREGDVVKFIDKRTLNKYKISYDNLLEGQYTIKHKEGGYYILDNGLRVNKLHLTKKGISNYALRLELEEFGENIKQWYNSEPSIRPI